MVFKPVDCAGQDISWMPCYSILLLIVSLTEFTSTLWVIILHEYKSLIHKLYSSGITWWCYVPWFNLPFTWCKSPTLQLAPPTITEPLLCFTVGVIQGGCSSFINSLLHIDPSIWPKDFKLWFISPKILFHSTSVQALHALTHWSFLTLFCFLNSGFLTAILLYRPASLSLLLVVGVDIFFTTLV